MRDAAILWTDVTYGRGTTLHTNPNITLWETRQSFELMWPIVHKHMHVRMYVCMYVYMYVCVRPYGPIFSEISIWSFYSGNLKPFLKILSSFREISIFKMILREMHQIWLFLSQIWCISMKNNFEKFKFL